MKKLLGLLVVSVFIFVAAVNVYAVTISTAGFTAEVIFADKTGDSVFGVVLKKITSGNTITATSTSTAGNLNWTDTDGTTLLTGVVPKGSTSTWVTSRVYAEMIGDVKLNGRVMVYTDNTDSIAYKFSGNDANKAQMGTLVISTKTTGNSGAASFQDTLPLVYKVVSLNNASTSSYVSYGMDPTITNNFGVFAMQDKAKLFFDGKNDQGVVVTDTTMEYNEVYSTIMTGKDGYRAGFIGDTEPGFNIANGDPKDPLAYHWGKEAPETKMIMFFASMFNNANRGFSYGTDTLTFELIEE
ncbi:MAG: hypothetical protein FWD54_00850 [Endomicrobia bacterium]|nr:hypothetical protein [Endomicrobiia bacterium]MCL2798821.1 hypothetical protein [Endomicrobiia bacterium]